MCLASIAFVSKRKETRKILDLGGIKGGKARKFFVLCPLPLKSLINQL